MKKLLKRGFNYSILPYKLDITQVQVDLKRLERSTVWKEFWHGKGDKEPQQENIFKIKKTNFPKNYMVPEGLKTFVNSIRSEIQDPCNRSNEGCNLPPCELEALKQLQRLQRDKQIIIRACDKGAGVMILDFNEYLKACYLLRTKPWQLIL